MQNELRLIIVVPVVRVHLGLIFFRQLDTVRSLPSGMVVVAIIGPAVFMAVGFPGVVVLVFAAFAAKSLRVLYLDECLAAYGALDCVLQLGFFVGFVHGFHCPAFGRFIKSVHCFSF